MSAFVVILVLLIAIGALKAGYHAWILKILREKSRADEVHTLTTGDGWRIKLFRFRARSGTGEPVLLCHGFSTNHHSLTLPAGNALVDGLTEQGYDCWAIDLRGTRQSEPPNGLSRYQATFDGYVLNDLPTAIAFIREATGYDRVHWVGHSMGGLLLYAYELVHGRDALACGITLGAPTEFENSAAERDLRIAKLMATAPWLAEIWMLWLAPVIAILKPRLALLPIDWENTHPSMGPVEFLRTVEIPPIPVAKTMLDCAHHRYLGVDRDRINVVTHLSKLETPLLIVAGAKDPVATPRIMRAFYENLPSPDKRYLELSRANGHSADYNHIDLVLARTGSSEVFAPIAEWMRAHPAKEERETAGKSEPETPISAVATPNAKLEAVRLKQASRKTLETAPDQPDSLWGKALKDAASILSDLEDSDKEPPANSAKTAPIGTSAPKPRQKARKKPTAKPKKKPSKKKATSSKPKPKKTPKKKAVTAPKKPAKKSASQKKKSSEAKKSGIEKNKVAKKKATAKKASKKKTATKKKLSTKKKTTPKKKSKKTKKKSA